MYRVYQVEIGDTIESIATRAGMSPQELSNLNGLTGEVSVGQLIVVPNRETFFETYTIKQGDNMYDIAKRYNVNLDDLLKLNGLEKNEYIHPGQQILIPSEGVSIYITNENETLDQVATKLGINPVDILAENQTIYLMPDQLIIYRI